MKFGVVIFPGSNCDFDLIYTLSENLGQKVEMLWHKEHDLKGCDFIFLPGGFSYGDYLRSGSIARFSPIMNEVIQHANKGGYVMGICNGFQILTEAGLLEGTLTRNKSMKFTCKNVFITPEPGDALVVKNLKSRAYKIPIAHAEGNFYCSKETMDKLEGGNQVLFRYCDEQGELAVGSNPNGSLNNIAGITNEGKNVFGMMPHPERAADPLLGNVDGKLIFDSILA